MADNEFGFSLLVGGQSALIGQIVSINLKEGAYWGLGPIWLTPTRYWARIPEGLSDDDYEIIQKSLNLGSIVRGKQFIPPVDKITGVVDEYWNEIKKRGISKELKDNIRHVILRQEGVDRGWTMMEIILECTKREKNERHDLGVLKWLEDALEHCEGPLHLYEPPEDEEGVHRVVVDSHAGIIKATNAKGEDIPLRTAPPRGHVGGTANPKEALGQLLD